MNKIFLILILSIFALGITGCGSNGDGKTPQPTSTPASSTYQSPLNFDMNLDNGAINNLTQPDVNVTIPDTEINASVDIPFDAAVPVPTIAIPGWSLYP